MPAVSGTAIPKLGAQMRAPGRAMPVLAVIGACALFGYCGASWMGSSSGYARQVPRQASRQVTLRYVVKRGDSFGGIAHANHLTLAGLLATGDNARRFADVNRIHPGEIVELPMKEATR